MSADRKAIFQRLYSANKEIWLVKFQPPNDSESPGGRIQLTGVCTNLGDKCFNYKAISYTWGPETPIRPIWIDGKRLEVRDNLWRCLQHCAKTGLAAGWLWIDTVSINQSDLTEKTHQVSIMGEIFSQAKQFLVWLGEASELSSLGTGFAAFNADPSYKTGTEILYESLKMYAFREYLWQYEDENFDQAQEDYARIVSSDYWMRLWVVPEILLARDLRIILGKACVNSQYLEFLETIDRRPDAVPSSDRSWSADYCHKIWLPFLRQRSDRVAPYKLSLLTAMYASHLCQNPRDKLYGLMPLVHPAHRLTIR